MANEQSRSQIRFDRRKAEIPQTTETFDFAQPVSAVPAPGRSAIWALSLIVAGLCAALAYGFHLFQQQSQVLQIAQARALAIDATPSRGTDDANIEFVSSPDESAPSGFDVSDQTRLNDERDAAVAALAIARQRIAALQAELGAPANGRPDISSLVDAEPQADQDQLMDTLMLEIRLLTRERDAARLELDGLLAMANTPNTEIVYGDDDMADLNTENMELRANLVAVTDELEAKSAEIEALRSENSEKILLVDDSASLIDELNLSLEAVGAENTALQQELIEVQNANESLFADFSKVQAESEALVLERLAVSDELAGQVDLAAELERELSELRIEYTKLKGDMATLVQERDLSEGQLDSDLGNNDLSIANARISELSTALSTANARIVALEALSNTNSASLSSASGDDNQGLIEEIEQLRDRQLLLETILARYSPQPPEPAPR